MKKIFLLVAFAGIVGVTSAGTFQDDKKHDCSKHAKGECKKDHDCSKHAKGECHKGMMSDSTKHCSKDSKKSCCKKGATPATPATPAK